MIRHSLLQCPQHRLLPLSSCGQAPPIWSSSSTPTPSWGTDRSFAGRSSTGPACPCGRRLTAWAHSPTRFGIWSQTQSTASASCSPGPGRGAPEHLDPLWSAGQSVQVSQVKHWVVLQKFYVTSMARKQIRVGASNTETELLCNQK